MRKKITVKQHDGNIEGYKLIIREIYEAGHPQEYMENFNTKFYNNDMTLTCKKWLKELKNSNLKVLNC